MCEVKYMENSGKDRKKKAKSTLGRKLQSGLRFRDVSRFKDEESFTCRECLENFKTRNWTYQKSPIMGYSCKETVCPRCKTKCSKYVPNGR